MTSADTSNIPTYSTVQEPKSEKAKPVWRSPGWLTAMAALVSAIIAAPQVFIGIFQANAEVKRQEIITRGSFVDKAMDTKSLSDRLVVLRWIVLNGPAKSDKEWAKSEIERINAVNTSQQEVNDLKDQLLAMSETEEENTAEYRKLETRLKEKQNELAVAKSQVGDLSDEISSLRERIQQLSRDNDELGAFKGNVLQVCVDLETEYRSRSYEYSGLADAELRLANDRDAAMLRLITRLCP
ncbi:MAG: hypothetical protein R3C58_02825 [Parvularculaceae bacterium]